MKTKLSLISMHHLQIYNSIVQVASGIFGGKKGNDAVKINDLSADAAISTMNRVFEMAGVG